MSTRDKTFFVEQSPLQEGQVTPKPLLRAWHRVALCIAYLAVMVVYGKWLLES